MTRSGRCWSSLVVAVALLGGKAAPVAAQPVFPEGCLASVCLPDGREAFTIEDFNFFAPNLPLLRGAPFDESPLGFFAAIEGFAQSPQDAFEDFGIAASSAIDRVPVPSGSTSVSYRYDDKLETFVRFNAPLAPALSQNARTNGKNVLTIGFAYTELDYDRFEGQDRDHVLFSTVGGPRFDPATNQAVDSVAFLDFKLRQQVYATSVSFGVLENLDVGVLIPVIDSSFDGFLNQRFFIVEDDGAYRPAVLAEDGSLAPDPALDTRFPGLRKIDRAAFTGGLVRSIFGLTHREDSNGIGDVIVRTRYFAGSFGPVDVGAAVNVATPTGDEENLLGVDAWRVDPRLLFSTATEQLAGHVNLGYHADTDDGDRDRFDYSVGAEGWVTPWLTVLVDHVGRLEIRGDTQIRSFEVVPGVKVNPYKDLILGFNAIVPLNDEGLTDDFIPNVVADVSISF